MYDSLTTNLPHPIMCYPTLSFPPSTPLFPKAHVVEEYLRTYAKDFDLSRHIKLNIAVTSARWIGKRWVVGLSNGEEHEYDRLIIANGHYCVPYFPPTPGLSDWIKRGIATHSAWYRSPHYVGDVVVVVGAGPSGRDLADEMRTVSDTLIHSEPGATPDQVGNVKKRGRAIRFSSPHSTPPSPSSTVHFEDGTSETGIDHCFLATGYNTSFPFFDPMVCSMPDPVPPLPAHLHNSSQHVFPLARELFPLQDDFPPTSVAFIGLPIKVIPFPLVEAQMRAVVKVFANPETLEPVREAEQIVARYEMLNEECRGDPERIAHSWPRFRGREQFEYRDALHAFAGLGGQEWKVRDWEVEMYERSAAMRTEWRAIEAAGEAEKWVKGVGEGGVQEWVDLMRRVVDRASKKADEPVVEEPKL